MAKLYITEFSHVGDLERGESKIQAALEPGTDQTPVNIGASSEQSAAFSDHTRVVRLQCDVACSIAFGANPTATTDNRRLPAEAIEYFAIGSASELKVAVIANP
jgi:hypothetical protein